MRGPADPGKTRPALATLLLAGSITAVIFSAWSLDRNLSPTLFPLFCLAYWAGVGFAWFVVVIMAFSLAYFRWQPRQEALGRRGASALLLVGVGAGQAVVGAVSAAVRLSFERLPFFLVQPSLWKFSSGAQTVAPAAWLILAAVAGITALLAGVLVLTVLHAGERLALSLGAILCGAGAFLLPGRFFTILTLALAGLALFQAWNPAPPTTDALQ